MNYIVSFATGAAILCCCSIFQKIMINANPFVIKGYLIPTIFGGSAGLTICFFLKKWKAELLKIEQVKYHRQLQKFESLEVMAGAIAHHFNNLMFVVAGNLEMAMDEISPDSEIASQLSEAIAATHRASKIGERMLIFLGQAPIQMDLQYLPEICRRSLSEFSDIPEYAVVNADLPENYSLINANRSQIQMVFKNIMINAWESLVGRPGAVSVRVRNASPSDISAVHRFPTDFQAGMTGYACLEVADTGCGMTAGEIEKIFDPFYSTKFSGRGLGLSVTLGIVKVHGGCIAVESTPRRGSVFRVFLPLAPEAASPFTRPC